MPGTPEVGHAKVGEVLTSLLLSPAKVWHLFCLYFETNMTTFLGERPPVFILLRRRSSSSNPPFRHPVIVGED